MYCPVAASIASLVPGYEATALHAIKSVGRACVVISLTINFTIGFSILLSVVVAVILMCLRESNRRSTEEAEKEEAELMEELGSSGEEM